MKTSLLRRYLPPLLLIAILGLISCLRAGAAPEPPLHVGAQTYTFRKFTVYEAIEKTAEAGGQVVEFFPGQTLSASDPSKMGLDLRDDQVEALREHLRKNRITAASCYIGIPGNEEQARKVFAFAKRLGLNSLTTESVGSIDVIDKMVKEFDVRVGFHGHPKNPKNEGYRLWDPQFILELVKDRDTRIGACVDTGHWATSGVVPVEGIRALQGRIINLHIKDRLEIGKATTDQILGTGVLNVGEILAELRRQKFAGCLFVEYETNWDNSVPDVQKCFEFLKR
jgi:sugar phosphate isomerase/epimerase